MDQQKKSPQKKLQAKCIFSEAQYLTYEKNANQSRTNGPINAHLTIAHV